MRAKIEIVEITDSHLLIRDLNYGMVSVTNDAEGVVKYLYDGDLLDDLNLYYIDSDGKKDQILHDGKGKFIGFNIL